MSDLGRLQYDLRRIMNTSRFIWRQSGPKQFLIYGISYLKKKGLNIWHNQARKIKAITMKKTVNEMIYHSSGLDPIPVVSLVIPVFNGKNYVPECIESIYHWSIAHRFEVIVVDQNSTDGVSAYLKSCLTMYKNFVLIHNKQNIGFAPGVNQAVAIARGEYIALCNSDLVFTPGWLDHLLTELENDPTIGIVSPMTNYVGEGPQVDPDAQEVDSIHASEYASLVVNRQGLIDAGDRLVFFCVALRRSLYNLLGGLAGVYRTGNYEDDDFCLRTRLLGLKLGIVKRSFVFHYGSRSFKENKIDYTEIMLRNESIYYERVSAFALSKPVILQKANPAEPFFSVVVRTKDRPHFLRQALQSLSNQTYKQFEVIVVNDGDMNVQSLVQTFVPNLNIRLIPQHHNGRSGALNTGIEEARSQWLTYLDDDDLVYPNHLEILNLGIHQNPDADLLYTNVNKSLWCMGHTFGEMSFLSRTRFADIDFDRNKLLIDNWIPIMSYVHRSNLAKQINGFSEELDIYEDWDFLLRFSQNCRVVHLRRITAEYRFRFSLDNNDTTLLSRQSALNARLNLYQRFPSQDVEIQTARQLVTQTAHEQINTITRIQRMNLNDQQKTYLLTTFLAG